MTLDELRALATLRDEHGFISWPAPFEAASVGLGEAEILYALVLGTKPKLVVELGTGLGVSSRFIAEALVRNGFGRLITVEPLEGCRNAAAEILAGLPAEIVAGHEYTGEQPDLVFIDSGPEYRRADIRLWRGQGPLIVVHDADRNYSSLRRGGVRLGTRNGLWVGR